MMKTATSCILASMLAATAQAQWTGLPVFSNTNLVFSPILIGQQGLNELVTGIVERIETVNALYGTSTVAELSIVKTGYVGHVTNQIPFAVTNHYGPFVAGGHTGVAYLAEADIRAMLTALRDLYGTRRWVSRSQGDTDPVLGSLSDWFSQAGETARQPMDYPVESLAGACERLGYGYVTNRGYHKNVSEYVTNGTALWTVQPPITQNWTLAEVHSTGRTSFAWTPAIPVSTFYGLSLTTGFPVIVTLGQVAPLGGPLFIFGQRFHVTNTMSATNYPGHLAQVLTDADESIMLTASSVVSRVRWYSVRHMIFVDPPPTSGVTVAVVWSGRTEFFDARPGASSPTAYYGRLYPVTIDQIWALTDNLRWLVAPEYWWTNSVASGTNWNTSAGGGTNESYACDQYESVYNYQQSFDHWGEIVDHYNIDMEPYGDLAPDEWAPQTTAQLDAAGFGWPIVPAPALQMAVSESAHSPHEAPHIELLALAGYDWQWEADFWDIPFSAFGTANRSMWQTQQIERVRSQAGYRAAKTAWHIPEVYGYAEYREYAPPQGYLTNARPVVCLWVGAEVLAETNETALLGVTNVTDIIPQTYAGTFAVTTNRTEDFLPYYVTTGAEWEPEFVNETLWYHAAPWWVWVNAEEDVTFDADTGTITGATTSYVGVAVGNDWDFEGDRMLKYGEDAVFYGDKTGVQSLSLVKGSNVVLRILPPLLRFDGASGFRYIER